MQPTEEQLLRATSNFCAETTKFISDLARKCDCNQFEALLLGRAIIHSLLDNLGSESEQEFKEFLAKVREGKIPL